MRVLITYYSESGNTEKMARAVAEGAKEVKGVVTTLKRVEETSLKDLVESDVIIVGSPTYYGLMAAPVKRLLDESVKIHGKLEGKVGGAFTSSGGSATGAETALMSILQALLIHGMIIQGDPEDKHYGAACVGKPGEKDLEQCRRLGKRLTELALRLIKT
ncbi:MAG: NAD(P)H-dependent oxidoreductase [Thermoproteota archaeon]